MACNTRAMHPSVSFGNWQLTSPLMATNIMRAKKRVAKPPFLRQLTISHLVFYVNSALCAAVLSIQLALKLLSNIQSHQYDWPGPSQLI